MCSGGNSTMNNLLEKMNTKISNDLEVLLCTDNLHRVFVENKQGSFVG